MTGTRPTPAPHPNVVLAVVLVAYLLIVLDLSIMYTGLPQIGATLHMTPLALTWVQNAYLLGFAGCLLLSARAGDLFGFRRMLLWGLALFSAASVVIGLAQSPGVLIAARAIQGIGASIIAPAVLALIAANFPAGEPRSRALAIYSMVAGAGASLGMVVGGVFAACCRGVSGFSSTRRLAQRCGGRRALCCRTRRGPAGWTWAGPSPRHSAWCRWCGPSCEPPIMAVRPSRGGNSGIGGVPPGHVHLAGGSHQHTAVAFGCLQQSRALRRLTWPACASSARWSRSSFSRRSICSGSWASVLSRLASVFCR